MGQTKKDFQQFLLQKGLKSTKQRDLILEEFQRSPSHLSTEELYLRLRKKHPSIGYATVYRTLKLFSECGIAEERHFGDGQTRYESSSSHDHHDHLICTRCGAIAEFEDPRIEELQQKVAAENNFQITSHRLDLYGLCVKCTR